jgi:hypothetical protein
VNTPVFIGVSPADIVPGALTRLGGLTPLGADSGWVPGGTSGLEPFNVYLLREGDAGLVVDSGPRALAPVLLEQLAVTWTGRELSAVLLRNELEAIGGIGPLLARYPEARLVYPGAGGVLDWIDYRQLVDGREHDLRYEATLVLGHPDAIELGPARPVHIIPPAISNLTITWLYDEVNQALFCADAFSFIHVKDLDADRVAPADGATVIYDEIPAWVTAEYVAAHLAERFFWLRKADRGRTKDSIRAAFERYPVRALCPSRGGVVRGQDAVAQLVAITLDAIDLIPRYQW